MIGQFLLAFRETLEAALIIAIVLTYLVRTRRRSFMPYAWYGVFIAVGASIALGIFVWFLFGGLTGSSKALFEGVAALIAVPVLSSMIYWMARKGKNIKMELERQLEAIAGRNAMVALMGFSFIVVFREGLETVLFLTPFMVEDVAGTVIGAALGIILSLILAYGIFVVGMKINLRKFFYTTSILLVLLAAGLVGYGVHEVLEYSKDVGTETGWPGEYAYALNIPESSPFHHKGIVGAIFAVMLGYTVKAEWLRLITHFGYLAIVLPLVIHIYRKPD